MTGYGAGEAASGAVVVKVELRSVNHRFFDPAIRISRDHAGLESRVRERLAARVTRGRIQAGVDVEVRAEGAGLSVDEELAEAYRGVLRTLQERYRLEGSPDAMSFAQLPDVVRRRSPEAPPEQLEEALDAALDAALDELCAMRDREGAALGRDLAERVARLGEVVERIDAASADGVERARQRLEARIAQLVPEGVTPDPERLATEVAILSDKADIQEELVRFRAHNEAFFGFLEDGAAVGKRLDFLLQEMNREANTIGSKAVSASVTHLVVEAKEEIERLREQVQNVE
jgi:uncharacterized protein (TIGR00255 family)